MEEKFREAFRADLEENLQKLNQNLLRLEKEPQNKALLEEIQRQAHTLKGSANMLGWTGIGKITHQMEDLLTKFLEKQIDFNRREVVTSTVDLLLATLDVIGLLVEAEVSGEESGIEIEGICSNLEKAKEELTRGEVITVEEGTTSSLAKEKLLPPTVSEETIRIRTDKIDNLINLIGELTIRQMNAQERLNKFRQLIPLVKELDRLKVNKELTESILTIFRESSDDVSALELVVKKLEESGMSLRMLPLATILTYFPRSVRDLGREYGREVELQIKGAETEMDKKILEMVRDPLLHLLRNAVAHGIEKPQERLAKGKPERGKIMLHAYQEGDQIYIEIEDDGQGIDLNKIKETALRKGLITPEQTKELTEEVLSLIFKPGFSTTEKVSEVSGRGVGLDVVRKNIIENLGGQVKVKTKSNEGTKFILILPLTLAVLHALLVEVNKEIFALPATEIELISRIKREDILTVEGRKVVRINDRTVPIIRLAEILRLPIPENGYFISINQESSRKMPLVVVGYAGEHLGLLVDRLISEQDIVIKSLSEPIRKIKNIAGATILGTGEPVLILHIPDLIDSAGTLPTPRAYPPEEGQEEDSSREKQRKSDHSILLVEDFFTVRELEKSILESWGYRVDTATDGLEALKKIGTKKYALVITDIQMPNLDGFSLCEKLRKDERYKDIPIIIVTALEKEEEKRRGLEVGADAYITKSTFEQEIFIETVEKLLGS